MNIQIGDACHELIFGKIDVIDGQGETAPETGGGVEEVRFRFGTSCS